MKKHQAHLDITESRLFWVWDRKTDHISLYHIQKDHCMIPDSRLLSDLILADTAMSLCRWLFDAVAIHTCESFEENR